MPSLNRATTRAAALMLGITAVSGGTGLWVAWQQSGALADQAAAASLLRNHMEADMMHDAIRSDALAAIEAGDPAVGIDRKEVEADLKEHLETLERRIGIDIAFRESPSVTAATGALKVPMDAYSAAARRIVQQAAADPAAAKAELPSFFTQFRALEESMSAASEAIEAYAEGVRAQATMFGRIGMIVLAVTLLAGMAASWLLASAARRMLIRPLLGLAGTMRTLDGGDLAVAVPHVDRDDELGDMAKAMDAFRRKLETAEAAKEVQVRLIVDTIGQSLDAMAGGDLTATIEADLGGPFAGLKRSFNEALTALRTLIGSVSTGTANIRIGANEIAQASEDLARRTERNAATLEQTSTAVAEIDERLKASAAAANQTVARADTAISVVGTGRALADDAVQAMGRVSESAQGIDGVIEGLDKIAFQTRVLAMNAAVEAGRAGEAGRGFAVVADLVSALAMRAEEEAGRARDQLTATQADIAGAVEAVQKVDAALIDISADVGHVHALLGGMAEDNNAQSRAISQVSTAIGAMDQGTQQNAAMVEQTSAAARNLTDEVNALAESAAAFNVADAPGMRTPRPARTEAAPTMH